MVSPKISLVVGNGFSISSGIFTGLINEMNSQSPLLWSVKCPSTGGCLLDSLPLLKAIFEENREKNSFEIFELALSLEYCKSIGLDHENVTLESRHFLTFAFSEYSLKQLEYFDENWPWYKWIESHKENIHCAFSLNYDILLENIFDRIRKSYYSLQINHHGFGIPLVKPHGSIDFEMMDGIIPWKSELPLQNYVDLNDTPIIRLEPSELLKPRTQAQCIIPNEHNKYKSFQWVKPANDSFIEVSSASDYCLFIGISYFECDRDEIDEIVKSLSEDCIIIVANPNPPEEFMQSIKGRPVMLWSSYDGPVDEEGNIKALKCLKSGKRLAKCFCQSGLNYQYCPCH